MRKIVFNLRGLSGCNVFLAVFAHTSYNMTADAITLQGEYTVVEYQGQNAKGQEILQADFSAHVKANSWSISATNRQNLAKWLQLAYDGTNTVALMPYEGHFAVPAPQKSKHFATISPTWQYFTTVTDELYMFVPWVAFGLSPNNLKAINTELLHLPAPWKYSRKNVSAYGYEWRVGAPPNSRFVTKVEVVRNALLDLPFEKELLRPDLIYPATISDYDRQRDLWAFRKAIPSGFVDATYECLQWRTLNGTAIPASAIFRHFKLAKDGKPYLRFSVTLTVTGASLEEIVGDLLPALTEATYTRDSRYTRRNEARIYRHATYVQPPGKWRAGDDPKLIAEAEEYLKSGPRFGVYQGSRRSFWLRIIFVATQVSMIGGVVWLIRKKKA